MTNELRILADGRVCCSVFDAAGVRQIPPADRMCTACKAHFGVEKTDALSRSAEEDTDMDTDADYKPLDPYARELAALQSAEARRSPFAVEYAAERLAQLDETRRYLDDNPAELRSLPAAELSTYAPPDPYAEDLKALQLKEAQARRRH